MAVTQSIVRRLKQTSFAKKRRNSDDYSNDFDKFSDSEDDKDQSALDDDYCGDNGLPYVISL